MTKLNKGEKMSKRVYISADYSENDGDRSVINELHKWAEKVAFHY